MRKLSGEIYREGFLALAAGGAGLKRSKSKSEAGFERWERRSWVL